MTDRPGHAWVDGRLERADGLHLSAFDRGFQLGDGVFETLRARGGRPTELDSTSRGSAAPRTACRSPRRRHRRRPRGRDRRAARRRGPRRTGRRRQHPHHRVARRVLRPRPAPAGRASIADDRRPGLAVPPTPASHLERGLHLVASRVRRDPENPLSALKTTSRADYVYARVEARNAGADDALFLTTDGFLSEATSRTSSSSGVGARDAGAGLRDPARNDAQLDPALGKRRRPAAERSLVDAARPRRGRRGVPVEQRRRDPSRDPVRGRADRRRLARAADDARTCRSRGVHRAGRWTARP